MNIDLENLSQLVLTSLLPFLISLLDDALLLGLARLGWNLPWLHWLSIILVIVTVTYSVIHLVKSKPFQKLLGRQVVDSSKV
ncbi:hypothetical protein H6G89_28620 [Oscillatoria sp. FACHB-1407]|uniref:hypothetical protein n=1 Tax=Oscillatoria sp. FACHB-1407 TaxID=2692847 RepID=UPI001681CDFC|nr:hypothetical protein [Oscillatoria sp. FACHB-1407]MBD2464973.1 hypothetical protein [Oscillatoria sp. FACHB-1407]